MSVYSHSQLSTFEECPRRYKFRYVDRIRKPEQKGIEAFTGTLVHETLQKLYDDLRYEKLNTLVDLLRDFGDRWERSWNAGVQIVRQGLGVGNYRAYGERCIRNYYVRHQPFDQSLTLATEMHVLFPLDSRHQFQGFVDRVAKRPDGTYEIHDYKTGSHLPAQADADADRQLALYRFGVRARWPEVERVELIWHYVALDSTLVSRRTPEQISELVQTTTRLIDRIEAETEFRPIESRLCGWCEYRPECPLWRHRVAVSAMSPAQMAEDAGVRLVNEYAAVRAQRDRLAGQLAALREQILLFSKAKETSVVQGNGFCVSVSERVQKSLPGEGSASRKELEEFVRSTGKWDEVSELNLRRICAAVDAPEWPVEWRDRLRGFLESKPVASLRLRRTEDRDSAEDIGGEPPDEPSV